MIVNSQGSPFGSVVVEDLVFLNQILTCRMWFLSMLL